MKKIFLTILAVIGLFIVIYPRFYHLGSQPPGLHIDEVSFAADAKAIAETGRDTWNKPWPLVFKAFGEWKAPGLTYSMAFWSLMLGKMDSVVARLPSAIAGLVILVLLGMTLRLLLGKSALPSILFTVFVLAFSPWHFDMSRIFYEAFSALAIFSIFLYFMAKQTIDEKYNPKTLLFAVAFAALAGYWYASIRYVVILSVVLFVGVQQWGLKLKLKTILLAMVTLFVVGFGWVGDLVSDRGLNRLYYYQEKAAYGASLEIDEKRQYCYLSTDRNDKLSKLCYLIWNKPVQKVTTAAKTYLTYLGSDYLFVKAESEFGFDSEYGAYLFPLLPLYIVGLFILLSGTVSYISSVLKKSTKSSTRDRVYAALAAVALISLAPAAVAGNINMRMSMVALYIVAITIGIGCEATYRYLNTHLKKYLFIAILIIYSGVLSFYIIQSISHYFLVFTHSNDLQWTSDAPQIFKYIKSISKDYDRIVDTELHGPLAPYFYGDISTEDVQKGEYSTPDAIGFTYLIKAGKYELKHTAVKDLACEKLSNNDKRRTLVITTPVSDLASTRKYAAMSWSQALLLHEIYDLDDIIKHEISGNANFAIRCKPKAL